MPLERQHRVCCSSQVLYPRMPEIANRPGSTREPTAWNAGTGTGGVTPLAGARIGQVANAGFPRWLLLTRRNSRIMEDAVAHFTQQQRSLQLPGGQLYEDTTH